MSVQQNSKFNGEQYATILKFLEDPQNKAKIFGVSGKTEVGVTPPRKIEAWKELAALINNKFKGKYKVTHKSVADRWRTYVRKYKAAREKSSATGFGVTDEDKKRNIHTVQAKLDMMCPHYDRIHALVGEQPNEVLRFWLSNPRPTRFTAEEIPNILDDHPPIAIVDSSGPHDITANANEVGIIPHTLVVSNEEIALSPPYEHEQATAGPQPEDDEIIPTELDASPVVAAGTKRHAVLVNSVAKKSKKDCRKELPSLSGTKNPTQTNNHLAQTIQDCASAKAVALVTIEEKRLKFEQMKWEAEREEREVRRKEEQEENEQKRQEEKEDERVRRAEDKTEKRKERRFELLQTMIAYGKSPDEMREILSMLL